MGTGVFCRSLSGGAPFPHRLPLCASYRLAGRSARRFFAIFGRDGPVFGRKTLLLPGPRPKMPSCRPRRGVAVGEKSPAEIFCFSAPCKKKRIGYKRPPYKASKGASPGKASLERPRQSTARTSTWPKINVALIGQGFMGRTHSNAWGQVAKFFKPPLAARHAHGLRAEGGESPELRRQLGLATCLHRLGSGGPLAGDRTGRRGDAQLHARPGGPGGHRRRQAVCLREADRRLAGRRPRDGRGGQEGQGQDLRLVQLSPLPGGGAGPSTGQDGQAWRNSPRAGNLLAGLGRRRGAAAVAVRQEPGRLRRPRRSERPHRRHDPLRHRPGDHRSRRRHRRDVHQGADFLPAWPPAALPPAQGAAQRDGHGGRHRAVPGPLLRRRRGQLRGRPAGHRQPEPQHASRSTAPRDR